MRACTQKQARNKGKDLLNADKKGTTEGLLLQSLPEQLGGRDAPQFTLPHWKFRQDVKVGQRPTTWTPELPEPQVLLGVTFALPLRGPTTRASTSMMPTVFASSSSLAGLKAQGHVGDSAQRPGRRRLPLLRPWHPSAIIPQPGAVRTAATIFVS